jgi:hypothetical protein
VAGLRWWAPGSPRRKAARDDAVLDLFSSLAPAASGLQAELAVGAEADEFEIVVVWLAVDQN